MATQHRDLKISDFAANATDSYIPTYLTPISQAAFAAYVLLKHGSLWLKQPTRAVPRSSGGLEPHECSPSWLGNCLNPR
jgi:hypothetical protein